MSDETYNAFQPTRCTMEEAEAAVGQQATLHLTGTITKAGASSAGPWVRFTYDKRWGFPEGTSLVLDLDALEITPSELRA